MGKWNGNMFIVLEYLICRPCPEILRRSVCIDLHRGKLDDNLVGSPVELGLGVGLLASLLISPGDGMDSWWFTCSGNGFHE